MDKPPLNAWTSKRGSSQSHSNQKSNKGHGQEKKFHETRLKLQQAVQKCTNYDSSSDEDEIEYTSVIETVVKSYNKTLGSDSKFERTEKFLQDAFITGAITCLICISRVRRDDQIWSCTECYCFFHLNCIQKWSKDSLVYQKNSLENGNSNLRELLWSCPKCRHGYSAEELPSTYLCFCRKNINPKYHSLLVPHSCGEICKKELTPKCGHQCLLLCHPGPCPPCPVTVSVSCYCAGQPPVMRRCSDKFWSCSKPCKKLLKCGKHYCPEVCHPGDCKSCSKKSVQKCICGSQQKLRECADIVWKCDKICGKKLVDCDIHTCEKVCHIGECGPCKLSEPRVCPCGKCIFHLACTEETPTCQDTCEKLLDCCLHYCASKCHRDECGACLEIITKNCRCGQHSKEIQCSKQYLCESKCKKIRDCGKHPCNKKCCDGNCPPCEKVCGKPLQCGNHKCLSVCHRGPCFPCNLKEVVNCFCGSTKITVPCGRKQKTKPPKCNELCRTPPDCHHDRRSEHKCHFGECPPCKKKCDKKLNCGHSCSSVCHSAVLVKIETKKATMPWEQTSPQVEKKALPCPDCKISVLVTCLGEHETVEWPCYLSEPSSCQRPCGRMLLCGNHKCTLPCHVVENSKNEFEAGSNCSKCENICEKNRPEGCLHSCPLPCHNGPCPPCNHMVRIKCFCGLTQPYIPCHQWTSKEDKEKLQSCGNQCPKNYPCGHRCRSNCHSGECPNANLCKKKVKVYCICKRIKKEFPCDAVRSNNIQVQCDDLCLKQKEEEKKKYELLLEQQKLINESKNKEELRKYEKLFEGKKKYKERRNVVNLEHKSYMQEYKILLISATASFAAFILFIMLSS